MATITGLDGIDLGSLFGSGGITTVNTNGGSNILNTGSGNKTINGTSGNDVLLFGSGNDSVNGGLGDDVINAGDGNNTLNGGNGNDVLSAGSGKDSLIGGSGNDVISGGGGNDILKGDDGNDTLNGGTGNDTLIGGNGNDRLVGASGTDILTGGAGNDIFKFNLVSDSPAGSSRDVITDFVGNGKLAGDQIDLYTIDANSTIAGNQAFTFIGANAFTAPGQLRYSGGILQANTGGNLSPEFEVKLAGAPQVVASDIIL
ncbi:calcium-binding protein [Nostoc sp.]|uniref:calcium-binding protein n=1 Tax=Nostoc sp. TaxID=1180 RepID=UPI002FF488A3